MQFDWTAIFPILGALLMWATQVGPKQVISHAAEWACTFGVRNPPNWLKSENADHVIRHVGLLLLLGWLLSAALSNIDIATMKLLPKILIAVGCLLAATGFAWNFLAGLSPIQEPIAKPRAPKVMLLPAGDNLNFQNNDDQDLFLWGTKVADQHSDLVSTPRIVPPNHHYYFHTKVLAQFAAQRMGTTAERMLIPVDFYFTDAHKNKFTGKFAVLATLESGKLTYHSQYLGTESGGWEELKTIGSMFINFGVSPFPEVYPPNGEIFGMPAMGGRSLLSDEYGGGGLSKHFGKPGQVFGMDTVQHLPSKLEITNYSDKALTNISMSFRLTFWEAVPNKDNPNNVQSGKIVGERSWPVVIPKLDQGPSNALQIWVYHLGPYFMQVDLPTNAKASLIGQSQIGEVTVSFPPGRISVGPSRDAMKRPDSDTEKK